MSQGQAFAQGTKPTQLNNPVPGADQDFANQAAVASVKTARAPQSTAQNGPSSLDALTQLFSEEQDQAELQAPQENQVVQQAPSKSDSLSALSAIADEQEESTAAPMDLGLESPSQPNPKTYDELMADLNRFEGKDIEASIIGLKVKQDKDGKILVKTPFGDSGWVEPNRTQRYVFDSYRSILNNGIGASQGMITGLVAGSYGGPVASAALGAIGAAVGGYGGQKMSQNSMADYLSDEENAKAYYLLGKVSKNESQPLTPMQAAVIEGGGNIFGSVISAGMGVIGKRIASRSAAQQGTADLMAGDMAEMAAASERSGIPLSAVEAAAAVENAGTAGQIEKNILAGKEGETLRSEYANAVTEKKKKAIEFVESIKNKFSPGSNFDTPSELGITKTVARGFNQGEKQKNVFSGVIDTWGSVLSAYRQDALERAGQQRADVAPLIQNINEILSKAVPGFKGINSAAEFEALREGLSSSVGDKETKALLGELAGFFNNIKVSPSAFEGEGVSKIPKLIVTDVFPGNKSKAVMSSPRFQGVVESEGSLPAFAVSDHGPPSMISPGQQTNIIRNFNDTPKNMGIGPNPSGQTDKGVTLGYINSFVDKLQDIAATTDNRYIQQLAGAARSFETDFMGKIYKDAGQENIFRELGGVKETFSRNIDELYSLQNGLAKNLSDPGGWVVTLPAKTLKTMKDFLPKDQFEEFAGAGIRKAIVEDAVANPSARITSQSLNSQFFGDKAKRESMEVLIGKENVKDLEAGLRILRVLEKKDLSSAAIETQANLLGKLWHGLGKMGDDFANFALYGNPTAANAVKKSLADYRSVYSNREMVGKQIKDLSKPIGTAVKAGIQAAPLY